MYSLPDDHEYTWVVGEDGETKIGVYECKGIHISWVRGKNKRVWLETFDETSPDTTGISVSFNSDEMNELITALILARGSVYQFNA